jgi:hypothetical protein
VAAEGVAAGRLHGLGEAARRGRAGREEAVGWALAVERWGGGRAGGGRATDSETQIGHVRSAATSSDSDASPASAAASARLRLRSSAFGILGEISQTTSLGAPRSARGPRGCAHGLGAKVVACREPRAFCPCPAAEPPRQRRRCVAEGKSSCKRDTQATCYAPASPLDPPPSAPPPSPASSRHARHEAAAQWHARAELGAQRGGLGGAARVSCRAGRGGGSGERGGGRERAGRPRSGTARPPRLERCGLAEAWCGKQPLPIDRAQRVAAGRAARVDEGVVTDGAGESVGHFDGALSGGGRRGRALRRGRAGAGGPT